MRLLGALELRGPVAALGARVQLVRGVALDGAASGGWTGLGVVPAAIGRLRVDLLHAGTSDAGRCKRRARLGNDRDAGLTWPRTRAPRAPRSADRPCSPRSIGSTAQPDHPRLARRGRALQAAERRVGARPARARPPRADTRTDGRADRRPSRRGCGAPRRGGRPALPRARAPRVSDRVVLGQRGGAADARPPSPPSARRARRRGRAPSSPRKWLGSRSTVARALLELARVFAGEVQLEAAQGAGHDGQRLQLHRALDLAPRVVEPAFHVEEQAVPLVRGRARVQLQRALQRRAGALPVPVAEQPHVAQRDVGVGEGVIQLQRRCAPTPRPAARPRAGGSRPEKPRTR